MDLTPSFSLGPLAIGLLTTAGSALINKFLNKSGTNTSDYKTPLAPDYSWLSTQGPLMWETLYGQSRNMIDNPYGIPSNVQGAMRSNLQGGVWGGYSQANRDIGQSTALSGLNPAGGSANRQRYYAGAQAGQAWASGLNNITMQDFQFKEDQRNRGLNLMLALSNKNPVMQQYASQNYWNAVNAAQGQQAMYGNMLGGMAGNVMDSYLMSEYLNNNPYSGSTYNPYSYMYSPYPANYSPLGSDTGLYNYYMGRVPATGEGY